MKVKVSICIYLVIMSIPCLYFCANKTVHKNENNEGLAYIINLTKAIYKPINYSDVFERVDYVKLETKKECLIDNYYLYLYLTDIYIIAFYFPTQSAYLFDRETGKFIKQIGSKGQGPNEYSLFTKTIFDEVSSILFFDRNKDWLGYHIETENTSIIIPPIKLEKTVGDRTITMSLIHNFVKIDSTAYAGYVNNYSGRDSIKLVIFDKDGNILKTFPNYQSFGPNDEYNNKNQNSISFKPYNGDWYKYNGVYYFKEGIFNDTIFRVTRDSMIPYISFLLGNKKPSYQFMGGSGSEMDDYYYVYIQGENDKYLFFNFSYKRNKYYCYFDKSKAETYVSNFLDDDGIAFFKNDLDEIPIKTLGNLNSNGETLGRLSAEKILEALKGKKTLSSKLQHLKNIEYDDNPIVVIAIPKK